MPPSPTASPAPAVRVHTLGRFLIEVDGAPLRFETKAKRKPLELLKVLVALGGETVPVEQLLESLWPDSDGDRAHSAFTTNLGRLRKLIGAGPLTLQDGRLTLEPAACWVDTRAFAEALRAAVRALDAGSVEDAWAHTEQALGLYHGPFLDGEFEPPELLSARERLHGQFLRHLEHIGERLAARGEHARAAALYQQGLEVDDLSEELYQQLMRSHLAQGRLVEGVAVYKRCKQLFRASVGIDPSPETEALHQALLAAQPAQPAAAPAPPAPAPTVPAPPAPAAGATAAPEPPVAEGATPAAVPAAPGNVAPEGERRTCTIASFALAGYAALSTTLDPEEVEEIMHGLRREAEGIVRRYGGVLNESLRDELHVLFGAPSAHEDDPVRAVRAAMEMQALGRMVAAELPPALGGHLRVRTGIYTGLMVVQPRAHRPDRYELTGSAINTAAELMALAGPDEILTGPETRRQIEYFFETEALPPVNLPGRAQPFPPYRVTGRLDVTTRFEAAAQRGLTAFTGRERELGVLQDCLRRSLAGEGQFVTVVGEAGLGKSRLLHEFQAGLDRDVFMVLECRTQAAGEHTPYAPFQDGLRRGLRLREQDSPADLVEKVVRNVLAVDAALEPYIPFYLYLLSIPSSEHPLPGHLTGGELRRALQEAIAAVGIQSTHQRPMVLLFEDWHWVDEASMETLRTLVGLMASHPLMIVVTYRPDYPVQWGALSYHTHLQLNPLDAAQTGDMLRSLLGAAELPAGLAGRICERTGGNPFFIEEVTSSLREEGTLQLERGRPVLTRALDELTLPDTVQAVIRTRVDRLDDDARQTLRLASVIGRDFGQRLLQRIAAQDVDLTGCLERLKAVELIQQTEVLPDAGYRFKHVLTQGVVYETLLRQQRRKLHTLVGESLEALFAGRLEEQYESLAYHFQRGNDPERALHYLERTAEKATQSFALGSARTHYRAAIALNDTLAQTDDLRRQRIDLSLRWASAAQYSPSVALIEALSVSQRLAEELDDLERQATVIYWRGRLLYVLGRLSQAHAEFEQVARVAERLGHAELIARCTGFMGRYCWHAGDYASAVRHLGRAGEMMAQLGLEDEVLYLESMQGTVDGWCGRFAESEARLTSVIERARAQHNPTRHTAATVFLAMVKALRGDWAQSAALAKAGHEGAERLDNEAIASMGRWTLGYATFMLGDQAEGLHLMADIPEWPPGGQPGRMLLFAAWLAEMEVLAGHRNTAIRVAEQALRMEDALGHRSGLPTAHRALGMAAALGRTPRWREAARHMEASLDVAESCGAAPEAAITRFRMAGQLLAQGNAAAARRVLDEADAAFRALEMPAWRAEAEALRGRLAQSPAKPAGRKSAASGAPPARRAKA